MPCMRPMTYGPVKARLLRACTVAGLAAAAAGFAAGAAANEVAAAAMGGDPTAVRRLLQEGADVDAAQRDGTTALHWAVRWDDHETAGLLIRAGAALDAANHAGATPMRLATLNGSAAMIARLLDAGLDPNAALSPDGDTALMMAARTGRPDAIRALLARGAEVNRAETWGGTTALMWAVAEHHAEAVELLIAHGADVDARSRIYPVADAAGSEGPEPEDAEPDAEPVGYSNGGFTPLLFAAREGDLASARLLIAGGATSTRWRATGRTRSVWPSTTATTGWRRCCSTAGRGWTTPTRKDSPPCSGPSTGATWSGTPASVDGDRRSAAVDPQAAGRRGGPEPIRRQDPALAPQLRRLSAHPVRHHAHARRVLRGPGARPAPARLRRRSRHPSSANETPLLAAAGHGWIDGYSQGGSFAERLDVIRLLVDLGADVNWADDAGITPLMVAANMGEVAIIQYLVDRGADLGAHDLGKKNDGAFGGSIEPLMPIDYAIGVGTFRPNNAIVMMEEAAELMTRLMDERGIVHTTSECTLRAFTCGDVDPMAASPAEIARLRAIQIGHRVEGIVGGLAVEDDPVAGAEVPR